MMPIISRQLRRAYQALLMMGLTASGAALTQTPPTTKTGAARYDWKVGTKQWIAP